MRPPFFRKKNSSRTDARSGRIVAVIHCILNQNSRDPGAAVSPAVSEDIVHRLLEHRVGIIQLPCPEMACLGLQRARPEGSTIRDALDSHCGRECCRLLARTAADQIEEHIRNNHTVLGIVGGNVESPGCAVHRETAVQAKNALAEKSGVFLKALDDELRLRGITIPFLPMRESFPALYAEDLEALDRLLSSQNP